MHRKHFLQKMSLAIVAAVALSTAAAASSGHMAAINQPMVLAQAGSTGGTIGKTDKSASGGEAPARARRAPARKHHVPTRARRVHLARQHHVSEAAATRSSCRKIVGTWLFPRGTEMALDQNGGGRYTDLLGTVTGKWRCANGIAIATWTNGYVDRMTISRDGNSFTGVISRGETWVATRK